jgi:DNA-directed RNA polymerase specialized sigma24 family protein
MRESSMDDAGSITILIEQVRRGNERGAQDLFDRYFNNLLGVARRKLRDAPRRAEDEEDVVLGALDSFITRARNQQFPQLVDRNNLWHLLIAITERKAINQRRRALTKKRGGGVVHVSGIPNAAESQGEPDLNALASPVPTPETIAQLSEETRRLFQQLDDDVLRTVARMKLDGYTNAEIADRLNVVERTIERKLNRIRSCWSIDSD